LKIEFAFSPTHTWGRVYMYTTLKNRDQKKETKKPGVQLIS